jgi:hypothetical protein
MRVSKVLRVALLTAMLAAASLGATAPGAAAYGKADQPLAQVEFSGNCDNSTYFLCADVVGVGGLWTWTEVDTGGTADFTGAGCGHVIGGIGGPGGAGGGPFKGTASWQYSTGVPSGAIAFWADPGNTYYLVAYPSGEVFAYPVTIGHYAFHPVPGVTVQLTVAP